MNNDYIFLIKNAQIEKPLRRVLGDADINNLLGFCISKMSVKIK